jgi:hypothetical protein
LSLEDTNHFLGCDGREARHRRSCSSPEPLGLGESAVGDGRRTSSGLSWLPGAAQRCPETVQGAALHCEGGHLDEVRLPASLLTWKATLVRPPYGGPNAGGIYEKRYHRRHPIEVRDVVRVRGQPRPGRLPGYPLRGVPKSLKEVSTLAAEDTLGASDVVSGFECPVVEVFE